MHNNLRLLGPYVVERVEAAAGVARVRWTARGATQWVEWPLPSAADGGAVFLDVQESQANSKVDARKPTLPQRGTTGFDDRFEFETCDGADECEAQNLVVFLHGRGDSHEPFARLGAAMALPQTACIALRAPTELPFDLGFTWIDDLDADFNTIPPGMAHRNRSNSLNRARDFVWSFLEKLREAHHWPLDRIFVFGFSQGACVALHLAMTLPCRIGGVVLVAGGAVTGTHSTGYASRAEFELPAILLCGTRDEVYPLTMAEETERQYNLRYGHGALVRQDLPKAHDMIRGYDEMRHIMAFLGKHLSLRSAALESQTDVIEINQTRVRP